MKNITKPIFKYLFNLPIWLHLLAVPAAIFAMQSVQGILDASYAASKFPVDYMAGQTGFSGTALKAWYQTMSEQGTLGIYWQTQFIDFAFIASIILLGLILGTFVARTALKNKWGYKFGMMAAVVIPLGAIFDVCENLISFIMLSMSTTFPDILALIYSGFAVGKFSLLTLGMALLFVSICTNLVERLVEFIRQRRVA